MYPLWHALHRQQHAEPLGHIDGDPIAAFLRIFGSRAAIALIYEAVRFLAGVPLPRKERLYTGAARDGDQPVAGFDRLAQSAAPVNLVARLPPGRSYRFIVLLFKWRHVYGSLHKFFADQLVDEVVTTSPCVLTKDQIPKNRDRDPEWRSGAVFSREEVQVLIASPAVPEDRQVLNALLFLTGCRFGEIAGLRWRDIEPGLEPLGRIRIAHSYEHETKTEVPRQVPMHPTLAVILQEWLTRGFFRLTGRAPTMDDLVIPSREESMRSRHQARNKFLDDLKRIGLRPRRVHDSRRTFITLARVDGARKDVLEHITHAPRGNIMDLYTTLPWPSLCEAVSCLKLDRVLGEALEQLQAKLKEAQAGQLNSKPSTAGLNSKASTAGLKRGIAVSVKGRTEHAAEPASEEAPPRRGRGRPRKHPLPEGQTTSRVRTNDALKNAANGASNGQLSAGRTSGLVKELLEENENRVAYVQKSWVNHAISMSANGGGAGS